MLFVVILVRGVSISFLFLLGRLFVNISSCLSKKKSTPELTPKREKKNQKRKEVFIAKNFYKEIHKRI